MVRERYIPAKPRKPTMTYRAHRLIRCPDDGAWPTSGCQIGRHRSPWRRTEEYSVLDPAAFLDGVRRFIAKGEVRDVDISRYGGPRFEDWEWIDRGYNLDTKDKREEWLRHVGDLLTKNLRLRLYGDDHPRGDA